MRREPGAPYGEGFWASRYRFLDYTGSRFMQVQEQLLMEQLGRAGSVPVTGSMLGGGVPSTVADFMRQVRLTTIEDYADELRQLHDSAAGREYEWAFTLFGAGNQKWVPYTPQAVDVLGENIMGAIGMASMGYPGEPAIGPGSRVVYNVPPRPYLAGLAAVELSRRFGLSGVIDPESAEELEFKERNRAEFRAALGTGVDILISMTSVLRSVSESFATGVRTGDQSGSSRPAPWAAVRYVTAKSRAKLARRSVRPSDLWHPKAILGWGLDTRHFSDLIGRDWGRPAYEMYASTEAGSMGLQYRAEHGIALNPENCFLEFLPESELDIMRNDTRYRPQTALLPEVRAGERYELVITSFYGMPFLRYRTGHLVKFSPGQLGFSPDMEHVGRADDRLDIGGFTRIDEATIWKAIAATGAPVSDWIVRRELHERKPELVLYAELSRPAGGIDLVEMLHQSLTRIDPLYSDVESMLGWRPLRVTLVNTGTFAAFYEDRRMAGEDLMARKPQRINAPDSIVDQLMSLSSEVGAARAA